MHEGVKKAGFVVFSQQDVIKVKTLPFQASIQKAQLLALITVLKLERT